jgi:uncharacterized protein with PQ loop repeat
MNETNPLIILLIVNSLFLVGSILNQNETKDPGSIQSTSSSTSPLELVTWISLFLQFTLLLIKLKFENI